MLSYRAKKKTPSVASASDGVQFTRINFVGWTPSLVQHIIHKAITEDSLDATETTNEKSPHTKVHLQNGAMRRMV